MGGISILLGNVFCSFIHADFCGNTMFLSDPYLSGLFSYKVERLTCCYSLLSLCWGWTFDLLVCKFKTHKHCASKATTSCKWMTLASIGDDIVKEEDGVEIVLTVSWYGCYDDDDIVKWFNSRSFIWAYYYFLLLFSCCLFMMQSYNHVIYQTILMPHQWMFGNLPVNAKCSVCEKTCGSIRRLQDWSCLWCHSTVSVLLIRSDYLIVIVVVEFLLPWCCKVSASLLFKLFKFRFWFWADRQ